MLNSGNRARALSLVQSNLPASITTPPMAVPWPPIHLVAEWTTMSAPCSIGRLSVAAPNVLSTTSGMPASWAISASAAKSGTSSRGLPIVST